MRDPRDIFVSIRDVDLDPAFLGLISQLIDERKRNWIPDMVRDPVQERLLDLIEDKRKGATHHARREPETEHAVSNVVNIMDALKRSVAAEAEKKKKPQSHRGR